MALPFVLNATGAAASGAGTGHAGHLGHVALDPVAGLIATAMHAVGYLGVTTLAAWLFFDKVGLGPLRKARVNLDLVWAIALIATGAMTILT